MTHSDGSHHYQGLTEIDYTTGESNVTVYVRSYDADGDLQAAQASINGQTIEPSQLGETFSPGFATEPSIADRQDLADALDRLRRAHCGYVAVDPEESILVKDWTATGEFSAIVYDKNGDEVDDASVQWSSSTAAVSITWQEARSADVTGESIGRAIITVTQVGNPSRRGAAIVDVVEGFPSIQVIKTPDSGTVEQGSTAVFTIEVHNTGEVPLTSVEVDDPQCHILQLGAESITENGVLDVEEHWIYACSIPDAQIDIANTATATASHNGTTISSTDTGSVVVVQGPVEELAAVCQRSYLEVVESTATTVTVRMHLPSFSGSAVTLYVYQRAARPNPAVIRTWDGPYPDGTTSVKHPSYSSRYGHGSEAFISAWGNFTDPGVFLVPWDASFEPRGDVRSIDWEDEHTAIVTVGLIPTDFAVAADVSDHWFAEEAAGRAGQVHEPFAGVVGSTEVGAWVLFSPDNRPAGSPRNVVVGNSLDAALLQPSPSRDNGILQDSYNPMPGNPDTLVSYEMMGWNPGLYPYTDGASDPEITRFTLWPACPIP